MGYDIPADHHQGLPRAQGQDKAADDIFNRRDAVSPMRPPAALLEAPCNGKVPVVKKQHSHYFKDVAHLDLLDVYRVLTLFNVTDPCLQHAIKKLLVAGGRGAGKDIEKDVREAIDSLARFLEMRDEDTENLLK